MKFSETIYLDSTENGVTMSSLLPGLRDSFYAEVQTKDVSLMLCRIAATGIVSVASRACVNVCEWKMIECMIYVFSAPFTS